MQTSPSYSGQSLAKHCTAPGRRSQISRGAAVTQASLKDVAGVLVFSALPFL